MAARRRSRRSSSGGFTLVEALIVVTIVGGLLAAALPSFVEFGRNQRIRATSYDLVADLLLARSEAIKRASRVTVVGNGIGWTDGWRVRVDAGLHAGTVLQVRDGPGEAVALFGATEVAYDGNGRLVGGGGLRLAVRDTVAGATRRCIEIDLSGLPRSRSGTCS